MISGSSPIPNQTMNTGIRPNSGKVRRICSSGSTAFSPSRLSPATRTSVIAATAPNAKPIAIRCSETQHRALQRAVAGELVVTRLTAVRHTVTGGGSFCAGTSPAVPTSCQSSTTATGVTSRYQPWPGRRRRPGRPGAAGRAPTVDPAAAGAGVPGGTDATGAAEADATRVESVISGMGPRGSEPVTACGRRRPAGRLSDERRGRGGRSRWPAYRSRHTGMPRAASGDPCRRVRTDLSIKSIDLVGKVL